MVTWNEKLCKIRFKKLFIQHVLIFIDRFYLCYGKCEKLGNMHIFRLLCIILKTEHFISDSE